MTGPNGGLVGVLYWKIDSTFNTSWRVYNMKSLWCYGDVTKKFEKIWINHAVKLLRNTSLY